MKRIELRRHLQKLKKKFRLTIFNESTLENFFSLRISLLDGISMGASLIIVLFFLSWILLVHTPMRAFLPQDLDPGMRKNMVQQAIRVDSLSNALELQAEYLNVLNGIISGDIPLDSLRKEKGKLTMDSLALKQFKLMPATRREQQFREDYEENEKFNLSIFGAENEKKELLFHVPLKGVVTSSFNPKLKSHGIRIESSGLQPCVAVQAGTVLFAGYTSDYDYVIQIQHSNDYVSVYKYNSELLKKQGDSVKAGEAIGMVGVNPARSGPPFLYFELWQKGIPMNPEEFIVF